MSTAATSPARRPRVTSTPRPIAVSISHVSKAFTLPHQRYGTLKERALHPLRSMQLDELHALQDVTVEIPTGEFFGIVGKNGSGKSTLLKCIAGIYGVDSGDLRVRGRLSPFIELGVGFNPELTARDNVAINAIMLGLTRKQVRERFDQIIAFAELEEFIDLKLKNYSSGMLVRLAFSVAIQVEAEILLIDEVLAVGDVAFQHKCFDEFERLKQAGRTILFVTHDMSAVERFCHRAMLIDRGRLVAIGEPAEIARKYHQINFGRTVHEPSQPHDEAGAGAPSATIIDAWFEDEDGSRIAALASGASCHVCVEIEFSEAIENPVFGITLRDAAGTTVFATATSYGHGPTGRFEAGETSVVRMEFANWLSPSRYSVTPSVARDGEASALDLREDMASLDIHSGRITGAVMNLPHSFEIVRS